MLIFLDFDGVTHPLGYSDFRSAIYLKGVVKKHPQVKFVFSTTWREYHSFEKMKGYMPNIVAKNCVGVTPMLENGIAPRYREIVRYIEDNGLCKEKWLAIDDNKSLFPKDCENLVLIEDGKGLNEKWIMHINQRLDQMKSNT